MQVSMAVVGLLAALLFGVSELADWKRRNRKDVDRVGFMPWRGLALISAATALFATALWIAQGGRL